MRENGKILCQRTCGGVAGPARKLHCHQAMHWLQVFTSSESKSVADMWLLDESESVADI